MMLIILNAIIILSFWRSNFFSKWLLYFGIDLTSLVFIELKGDVYPVEPDDEFTFQKVLDPHWGVVYDEDVRIHSLTAFSGVFCLSS